MPQPAPSTGAELIRALREVSLSLDRSEALEARFAAAAGALVPVLADGARIVREPATAGSNPVTVERGAPEPEGGRILELLLGPPGAPSGSLRLWRGAGAPAWEEHESLAAEEVAGRLKAAIEADDLRIRIAGAPHLSDDFLATLSHELRAPLNVMFGWIDLLRDARLSAERKERGLEVLSRNARAQARLLEDLIDVSRIVSGRLRLKLETVPIAELAAAAVEALRPRADTAGVSLELEPGAPLTIEADGERLNQLLQNLLENALKFTPRGGRVTVSVSPSNGDVVLSVKDTGEGIAPDLLPRVFERFRQGERKPHTGYSRGLGLGLFIARHIAVLHGGTITAASDGPGRGATFTVRLPTSGPRP